MAPEAVRILRGHGYAARPLDGGLPEWRRAGLPITTGAAAVPAPDGADVDRRFSVGAGNGVVLTGGAGW